MGYAARRALAAELHWTAVLVVLFSVGMYYRGFGLDASFTLEELVDLSLYPIDDLASAVDLSARPFRVSTLSTRASEISA